MTEAGTAVGKALIGPLIDAVNRYRGRDDHVDKCIDKLNEYKEWKENMKPHMDDNAVNNMDITVTNIIKLIQSTIDRDIEQLIKMLRGKEGKLLDEAMEKLTNQYTKDVGHIAAHTATMLQQFHSENQIKLDQIIDDSKVTKTERSFVATGRSNHLYNVKSNAAYPHTHIVEQVVAQNSKNLDDLTKRDTIKLTANDGENHVGNYDLCG